MSLDNRRQKFENIFSILVIQLFPQELTFYNCMNISI